MNKKVLGVSACVFVSWHAAGWAQVLEYIDCEVDDVASFIAANTRFHDAMSGGQLPTISLDANLWNGSSPVTHTVILAYDSHQSLEAFFERVESNPGPFVQLINSLESVSRCDNEGLAVELGAWGDMEAS